MNLSVQEIERAIAALTPEQREELCAWLDENYLQQDEARLKADIEAGLFDERISRAITDHKAGRTEPLLSPVRTMHRTTADFWKDYRALPADIRERADKQFVLLKTNRATLLCNSRS